MVCDNIILGNVPAIIGSLAKFRVASPYFSERHMCLDVSRQQLLVVICVDYQVFTKVLCSFRGIGLLQLIDNQQSLRISIK